MRTIHKYIEHLFKLVERIRYSVLGHYYKSVDILVDLNLGTERGLASHSINSIKNVTLYFGHPEIDDIIKSIEIYDFGVAINFQYRGIVLYSKIQITCLSIFRVFLANVKDGITYSLTFSLYFSDKNTSGFSIYRMVDIFNIDVSLRDFIQAVRKWLEKYKHHFQLLGDATEVYIEKVKLGVIKNMNKEKNEKA